MLYISDARLNGRWSLDSVSHEGLIAPERIEVIAKLGLELRWRKYLIFYYWFWSQGKLIIINDLFVSIFRENIFCIVWNRHSVQWVDRIMLRWYLFSVLHHWSNRLISISSFFNLEHVFNLF